ncbi:hypothetical protein MPK70_gp066 [Erwinia phage pEa_SNUABM_33]|uniref:Uncharacterized protein n=1 Tax=Erwinia phage pEa_SNUABM_33 TaxID=2869556 RepID=A0AAE8C0C2_9CAUD|nr:hypothetical protein MPK70_gp066 [Erwinia phage pEa_SNUABM_33]QZE57942.1 hypothetical protein pEaSNUABM33_00066 [Erwinia phage pEa_SNUABM_33]WAK44402.1 hypothetical protein [Erwinia phage vB_Ea_2910A]
MAMTELQFALSMFAQKCTEASALAIEAQQFGLEHKDGNGKSVEARLYGSLRDIDAARYLLEEKTRGFEYVPDLIRALNRTDELKALMEEAKDNGQVLREDEADEDEDE